MESLAIQLSTCTSDVLDSEGFKTIMFNKDYKLGKIMHVTFNWVAAKTFFKGKVIDIAFLEVIMDGSMLKLLSKRKRVLFF